MARLLSHWRKFSSLALACKVLATGCTGPLARTYRYATHITAHSLSLALTRPHIEFPGMLASSF